MTFGFPVILVPWRAGGAVSLPFSPVPRPLGAIGAVVVLAVPHVARATGRGGAATWECLRHVLRTLREAEQNDAEAGPHASRR